MIRHAGSETVILLHGLASHRIVMSRLARLLRREGFRVLNWGYPSVRPSILSLAERFQGQLQRSAYDEQCDRLHIVAHSMGSIVTRQALATYRPAKLGRIVMLGPPNSGSHVARCLSGPLGNFCPPLRQLSDEPNSFVNRLEEPQGLEIGIIAARHDFVVKLENTYLGCQRDHVLVPGPHSAIPLRRDTARHVINFLRFGKFHQPVPLASRLGIPPVPSIATASAE